MSFALKIVWFVLSVLGVVAAWSILTPLAKSTGSTWAPLLYCTAVSALQIMFCIGMVWCMNPVRMPHSFCVAQIAIMSFAAYVLVGLCTAFTFATTYYVHYPKGSAYVSSSLLRWRPIYLLPILAFPLAVSIAHLTVVIRYNAVQPLKSGLGCDATDPLWTRLVGYAGPPLLLAIPCFLASLLTAYRIRQARRFAHKHSPAQPPSSHIRSTNLTSLPKRISRRSRAGFPMSTRFALAHSLKTTMKSSKVDLHPKSDGEDASMKLGTLSIPTTPRLPGADFHTSSPDALVPPSPREEFSIPPPPSSRAASHSHPNLSISTDTDSYSQRSASPSPITFAPVAPLPVRPRPAGQGPYPPSFPDTGPALPAFPGYVPDEETASAGVAVVPEEPEEPTSGSRSPVAFDVDSNRGFHLPLRPSLELSPEYAMMALRQAENEQSLTTGGRNGAVPEWLSSPPTTSTTKWGRDRRYRVEDVKEVEEEDNITLDTLGWSGGSRGPRSRNGSGGETIRGEADEEGDYTVEGDADIHNKEDYAGYEDINELSRGRQGKSKALDRLGIGSPVKPSGGDSPSTTLWRLVVLQLGFFAIVVVGSISTIVDVIRQPPEPMAFGSQYVAMLLFAWWPAAVFGHVPERCRRLYRRWRRRL